MVINEEAIRRMVGRSGSAAAGGGGVNAADLAGYATQAWVSENFLSIEFFNRLFKAHGATDDVLPNDTETTITDIEAMFGFWTKKYISALGKNSSGGGGGGGASSLAELDDVSLGTLANGQALVYDSTTGKWKNGTVIPDLTDYATKTWVGQQGYITTSALTGYATETWVEAKGYITASALTGYATESWVEAKGYALAANVYSKTEADARFLTVAFFDRLFRAYNGTTLVSANDTASTIDNIKAMFGFWTNQYISALGKNSSGGGGGGGASSLSDLDDVSIGTLTNGQALVYDSTTGKWKNGTVIPDLTDYATKTWVGQQGYITTSALTGYATETWVTNKGYATETWVTNKGYITASALTGYATESWVEAKGYLTTETDPTVPTWAKASTKPSYQFSEIVGTAAFSQLPTLYWANVQVASTSNTATSPQFAALQVTNNIVAGGSVNAQSMELSFTTPFIDFHHASSTVDFTSRFITTDYGVMSLQSKNNAGTSIASALAVGSGFNGSYIEIGNIRIVYDSTNNALEILKSDGTPAGLYATGGISALGMSAGVSSVAAMTFGNISVTSKITGGEGSFTKLGVSGSTSLRALTVGGALTVSSAATFNSTAYFGDDIIINAGGTDMYLDTAKCVELGILI